MHQGWGALVGLDASSWQGSSGMHFVSDFVCTLCYSKSPPLFKRGASSCSSQRQRQREPRGASPRPSAPTYLPLCYSLVQAVSQKCIWDPVRQTIQNTAAACVFVTVKDRAVQQSKQCQC